MSDNILRKKTTGEAGNGGEFGTKNHSEAPDGVIVARRAELDSWPAALPDPDLDFAVGDDGVITTLKLDGRQVAAVSNRAWVSDDTFWTDEMAAAHARDWTLAKSDEINSMVRHEIDAAVARSRAAIIAAARGAPVSQSDDDLDELIMVSSKAMADAEKTLELASASLMSRKILAAHPGATYVRPEAEFSDQVNCSMATVLDDDLNQIVVFNDFDGYEDADVRALAGEIVDLSHNLSANAGTAWWPSTPSARLPGYDDVIDLKSAAAWSPEPYRKNHN